MIELRQNKIWSDSLNSTLEFDQPWDYVDRGLHKFICFGEGGGRRSSGRSSGRRANLELDIAPAPSVQAGPSGGGSATGFSPDLVNLGAPPALFGQSPDVIYGEGPSDSLLGGTGARPLTDSLAASLAAPLVEALTPKEPVVPPGYNPSATNSFADFDDMTGFGPVSRADIASVPGFASEINPGLNIFGYQTGIGRGMFGDYTSTDSDTAQGDTSQGYGTKSVGSFDPLGFLAGVGKAALSLAAPGAGLAVTAAQELGKPEGMKTTDALSNVFGSDRGLTRDQVMGTPYGREAPAVDVYRGSLSPGETALLDRAEENLADPMAMATNLMKARFYSPEMGRTEFLPRGDEPLQGYTRPLYVGPTLDPYEKPVKRAQGGLAGIPYFEGRVMPTGDPKEDGMSDNIPFVIAGQEGGQMGMQPAILSPDEYVIPADVVSMLGNGSSTAGSNQLDQFISNFRMDKYGRPKQPPEMRGGLSSLA